MSVIKPERYNEFGEIVQEKEQSVIYERKLSAYQQHIIHVTKDLFESNCSYCQDATKKYRKTYWGEDE